MQGTDQTRKVWRPTKTSHPYVVPEKRASHQRNNQRQPQHHPHRQSQQRKSGYGNHNNNNNRRRSSQRHSNTKTVTQTKHDKVLEVVMKETHRFFQKHPELSDGGVSRSQLCEGILNTNPHLTLSEFRLSMIAASKLKLINTKIEARKMDLRRNSVEYEKDVNPGSDPRKSGDVKITLNRDPLKNPEKRHSDGLVGALERDSHLHWNDEQQKENGNDFKFKDTKCFFCNKLFYNKRGVKQHCHQAHHQAFGYEFKCTKCVHVFKTQIAIDEHLKEIHSDE